MNHYALRVPEGVENIDLLRFMRDAWPLAPAKVLRDAFKLRDVKVNGKRVSGTLPIAAGDLVAWYTLWAPEEIPVVYQDSNILVVNKPAGLSSDQQRPGSASILTWAKTHLGEQVRVRLVHRLDQQTSGLLVLALSEEAEEVLLQLFQQRRVVRAYTCLAGGMPPEHGILEDHLIKDAANALVTVRSKPMPGSKPIKTEFALTERSGEVSRLLVTLHTGRTHQIRAHLAFHGWPVLGDDKYGDRALNKRLGCRQLRLACTMLGFPSDCGLPDIAGKTWRVDAPF